MIMLPEAAEAPTATNHERLHAALNRALRFEHVAIRTYATCLEHTQDRAVGDTMRELLVGHRQRSAALMEYIQGRAGRPDTRTSDRGVLMRAAVGVAVQLGSEIVLAVLRQMEAEGVELYADEQVNVDEHAQAVFAAMRERAQHSLGLVKLMLPA